MKKYKVFVIMLVAIMCLGLVSIPNAFSQVVNPNVKVLSYSDYVNSSGDFIVVGEVQNTGNTTLQSVTVNATAYDSSGNAIAGDSNGAFVSYFLPQQKAPFYLDFGKSDVTGISSASSVSYIDFDVFNAYYTTYQQYQDLQLNIGYNGTIEGAYVVVGFVSNSGNKTANGIAVVATYYNSLGTVVAVGVDEVNGSLAPNNATAFTVAEYDVTTIVSQISSYSLLVQTSTPEGNYVLSSTSTSSSSLSLSSSELILAVLGTVAIVVVAVTALVFMRKRRNLPPPPPPPLS